MVAFVSNRQELSCQHYGCVRSLCLCSFRGSAISVLGPTLFAAFMGSLVSRKWKMLQQFCMPMMLRSLKTLIVDSAATKPCFLLTISNKANLKALDWSWTLPNVRTWYLLVLLLLFCRMVNLSLIQMCCVFLVSVFLNPCHGQTNFPTCWSECRVECTPSAVWGMF